MVKYLNVNMHFCGANHTVKKWKSLLPGIAENLIKTYVLL